MSAIISRPHVCRRFLNKGLTNVVFRAETFNNPTQNNGILRIIRCCSTGTLQNIAGESTKHLGVVSDTYEEQITSVLSKYPDLRPLSSHLRKFLDFATSNGFSLDDGITMVTKCKEILGKSESNMYQTISNLRHCKFNDDDILRMLKSAPELFCADPDGIVQRYASFRNDMSHKLIKEMFCNCPSVTFMKWNLIQEKIRYLRNDMFASNSQIAGSNALQCPLNIIKARHTLLERAGVFKKPNPKSNMPLNNPSISEIVDTEDEYFAEKVAGLTAEEYFVFLDMFVTFSPESREGGDDDSE